MSNFCETLLVQVSDVRLLADVCGEKSKRIADENRKKSLDDYPKQPSLKRIVTVMNAEDCFEGSEASDACEGGFTEDDVVDAG